LWLLLWLVIAYGQLGIVGDRVVFVAGEENEGEQTLEDHGDEDFLKGWVGRFEELVKE
jgi:hypothetical protein